MLLSREPLRANIEQKARIDDHDAALATALSLGAEDRGEIEQEDTYFSLGRYRIKLRESSDGQHCLIGYSRPDEPGARKSQFRLQPVENPESKRKLLAKTYGVKVVVRKWRRVFIFEGHVRIHVDRVEGLGDFIEFEGVLEDDYDEWAALLDLARLAHDFGLDERDMIATSYSTLIKDGQEIPQST